MADDDWRTEYEAEQLRRQLDLLLRSAVPSQWIDKAVDAVLSEACPLVTPAAHLAAIKKEIDWQHYWADKYQAARAEVAKLRDRLDISRVERVEAVLRLLRGMAPSRTAKHDETCHQRHAGCLAEQVRHLLTGEEVPGVD